MVPRSQTIEGVQRLRDHGFAAKAVRTTTRLPTDGVFDLRTYHPGDDVRRIHWVRSAVAGELVVRMPDELPPDRPRVCLVLDTYVPKAFALDCDAPSEVLDGLVAVWLAVGRALCASGARVTLVTVLPGSAALIRHVLSPHAFYDSQRLGARVGWQHQVPVERLLTSEATYVVARGLLAEPPQDVPHARWIVAVPAVSDPNVSQFSALRHLFPFGSTEIRWSHRRRVLSELLRRRIDHARAMRTFGTLSARPPAGSFAAYRGADGVLHLGELGAAS